jgi:hypothetical protein
MERHGWSQSSDACRPDASATWPYQLYLFDSHFPQAHVLGNRTGDGRMFLGIDYAEAGDGYKLVEDNQLSPYADAVVVDMASVNCSLRSDNPLDAALDPLVGRYGVKLGFDNNDLPAVASHEEAGCVVPCKGSASFQDLFCGSCSVLKVHNASIAAAVPWGKDFAVVLTTLRKMIVYSTHYATLPWCGNITNGGDYRARTISVFLEGSLTIGSVYSREELFTLLNTGLTLNCTFWDEMGVGLTAPPDNHMASATRSVDTVQPFWVSMAAKNPVDSRFDFIINAGVISPDAVKGAIRAVVVDATRVLARVAGDELATTDLTKTVAGAVLDLSVTLVGIVAMASGRADVHNWFLYALSRRPVRPRARLARALTCAVVLAGLVMAPAFIVAGEERARKNNPDGSTSKLGLLAAEAAAVIESEDPFIVVAALTARVTTEYSPGARVLMYLNLGLAATAALWICADVLRPVDRRGRLERLRAFRRNPVAAAGAAAAEADAAAEAGGVEAKDAAV